MARPNIGCIIQARMGSTRLPGKVMEDIGGWPMVKHVRIRMSHVGVPVVVMVPPGDMDTIPEAYASEYNPSDMVKAYLMTALAHGFDGVVRVTGDCPFIDPFVCQDLVEAFRTGLYDLVANDLVKTFPDGLGCEVVSIKALRWADFYAQGQERDHVVGWIKKHLWPKGQFMALNGVCYRPDVQGLKFSVDTPEDLQRARLIDEAGPSDYSLDATVAAYRRSWIGQ